MKRTWAIFCMAVWITGTLWMAIVATENFFTIERLLDARPNVFFNGIIEKVGPEQARDLLWYLASELNRLFFQVWGLIQIVIGVLALWFVVKVPRSSKAKWMIVSMLGICLLFAGVITPEIVSIGRSLDFVPRTPSPAALRTFGLLHTAYTVLDGIKLLLGILVTVSLSKVSAPAAMPAVEESRFVPTRKVAR